MAFVTVSDTTPTQRQRQYQLGGNFLESQRPIPVECSPQVAAADSKDGDYRRDRGCQRDRMIVPMTVFGRGAATTRTPAELKRTR